jgi:hypothetical protein
MIYGYSRQQDGHGLLDLREVTLAFNPQRLRLIARFLEAAAAEMETDVTKSSSWHRHLSGWAPEWLQSELVDVIVMAPQQ